MPFILAIIYLIFYHWERKEKRKAYEKEQRRLEKKRAAREATANRIEAEQAYDKRVYDEWKKLVCDKDLERKVRLYLLDENNKPEYEPWLQNIYDGFKIRPRKKVSQMKLSRFNHNKSGESMFEDPLELKIYGMPGVVHDRAMAVSFIMAEFGKLSEYTARDVIYETDGTEEHVGDCMEYLANKLSKTHPEHKIAFRNYGPWLVKTGVRTWPAYYWIHNDLLVFDGYCPDWFDSREERKFNELLDDIPLNVFPEDIEKTKREISRMKIDMSRRYKHLK